MRALVVVLVVLPLAPLPALHAADLKRPVKVFVLAGQSNMEGQGGPTSKGRTLVMAITSSAMRRLISWSATPWAKG